MKSLLTCGGFLVALASFAPAANATPITYTLSGTASGQIGGTPFTNALVTYTAHADTDGVQPLVESGFTFYANPFNDLTVDISGIGTATILDLSDILGIPVALPPNPEIPSIPIVIFGRLDPPFDDLGQITGMGAVGDDALAGYDLKTAIAIVSTGSIGFPTLCGTPGHDPCLHTSSGLLSYTTNGVFADGYTFTAMVQPVPEPATVLLVSGGLAGLARRARRRNRG